jgi:hypothetical protein
MGLAGRYALVSDMRHRHREDGRGNAVYQRFLGRVL